MLSQGLRPGRKLPNGAHRGRRYEPLHDRTYTNYVVSLTLRRNTNKVRQDRGLFWQIKVSNIPEKHKQLDYLSWLLEFPVMHSVMEEDHSKTVTAESNANLCTVQGHAPSVRSIHKCIMTNASCQLPSLRVGLMLATCGTMATGGAMASSLLRVVRIRVGLKHRIGVFVADQPLGDHGPVHGQRLEEHGGSVPAARVYSFE